MKEFKWKMQSQVSDRLGKKLIKGETYKVKDFPAEVVAHWVKQKAAEYIAEPVKKTDTGKGKGGN
jgi:hypothetical protein